MVAFTTLSIIALLLCFKHLISTFIATFESLFHNRKLQLPVKNKIKSIMATSIPRVTPIIKLGKLSVSSSCAERKN